MGPERPVLAQFAVSSERRGSPHRVAVRGELDLANAPLLEREFLHVAQAGVAMITVDVSDVTFIDSTRVHLLRRAHLDRGRTAHELRPGSMSPHTWPSRPLPRIGSPQ